MSISSRSKLSGDIKGNNELNGSMTMGNSELNGSMSVGNPTRGAVKSVNGVKPDKNGNVEIEISTGGGFIASDTPPEDTSVLWIDTDDNEPNELQEAINEALAQAKASGEFDGKDYVLTDADKQEIAEQAAQLVDVSEGSGVQPDWTQNDTNAKDYIKNRPFWEEAPEEKVLFQETLELEEPYIEIEDCSFMFEEGKEYKVDFNGENYTCIAYFEQGPDTTIIGNMEWDGEEPTGNNEPFVIMAWDDGYMYIAVEEPGEYNISITGNIAEVHKIDSKYIDTRTINKLALEAYELAENVYWMADSLWNHLYTNVPQFVHIDGLYFGRLEPMSTSELQVGEITSIKEYPSQWNDYVTSLPIGSQISGDFTYIAKGKTCAGSITLTKESSIKAEGGAWVTLNCDTPRYYYIILQANGGSTFYYRYV